MPTTDPVTVKGDASLVPPAEIGDNSGQEERAFKAAQRTMIDLIAQRKALAAKISKARKQMKADGIVLGDLDEAVADLDRTPAEIRENFARKIRYAGYNKVPLGQQIDLLANASEEDVAKADWRSRGRSDALRLKPASPGKSCPPERVQDYMEGHAEAWWITDGKKGS